MWEYLNACLKDEALERRGTFGSTDHGFPMVNSITHPPFPGWDRIPNIHNYANHLLPTDGRAKMYEELLGFLTNERDPNHVNWDHPQMELNTTYRLQKAIVEDKDRWFRPRPQGTHVVHDSDLYEWESLWTDNAAQTRSCLCERHPNPELCPLAPVYLHPRHYIDVAHYKVPGVNYNHFTPKSYWNSRAGILASGRMLAKTNRYYNQKIVEMQMNMDTMPHRYIRERALCHPESVGVKIYADEFECEVDGATGLGPDYGFINTGKTVAEKNPNDQCSEMWVYQDFGATNILRTLIGKGQDGDEKEATVIKPTMWQRQCSHSPHTFVGSNPMIWFIGDNLNITNKPQFMKVFENSLQGRVAPAIWLCVHWPMHRISDPGNPGFHGETLQKKNLCSNPELLRRYLPYFQLKVEDKDDNTKWFANHPIAIDNQSGGFYTSEFCDKIFAIWEKTAYLNGPFVHIPTRHGQENFMANAVIWTRTNDLDPKRTVGLDPADDKFDMVCLNLEKQIYHLGHDESTPEDYRWVLIKHLRPSDGWSVGYGQKREQWLPFLSGDMGNRPICDKMQGTFCWFYQTPGSRRVNKLTASSTEADFAKVTIVKDGARVETDWNDEVWAGRKRSKIVYDFIPDGCPGIPGPHLWWFRFLAQKFDLREGVHPSVYRYPHQTYNKALTQPKITAYLRYKGLNPTMILNVTPLEKKRPYGEGAWYKVKDPIIKFKKKPYFSDLNRSPINSEVFWKDFIPQFAFDAMGCTPRQWHELCYYAQWYYEHSTVLPVYKRQVWGDASPTQKAIYDDVLKEMTVKFPDIYQKHFSDEATETHHLNELDQDDGVTKANVYDKMVSELYVICICIGF